MKILAKSIPVISLVILTIGVVYLTWGMVQIAPVFMYDYNVKISSTLSPEQSEHMSKASTKLAKFLTVPMGIVMTLWIIAFFVQRRELKELKE